MRISTASSAALIRAGLTRPAERLGKLSVQISSGKRVNTLSDDPLAAAQTVRLQGALAAVESRRTVLTAGTRLLGAADTALGTMGEALRACGDAARRAQSAALGETERRALAQEIRSHAETLQRAGNESVQGVYVFAGTATDVAPLAAGPTGVRYVGNATELRYQTGAAETVPVSLTGLTVFNFADAGGGRAIAGVDTDVFEVLERLATCVEAGETEALAAATRQVDACREHVLGLRGQVGLRVQRCETGLKACDDTEVQLQSQLSETQDVDIVEAMTALSGEQTAYQAALSMAAKLLGMPNLFEVQW